MENQTSATQTSYALCEWLNRLFAAFGKASTPEVIAAYTIGLGDMSEAHLKLAFEETLRSHKSSFAPTPGEIRGYLERALENLPPAGSSARPDCPKCWGGGFTIIELKDSKYAVAARCSCLLRVVEGPRAS